jgi:hypothetical protein
MAHAVELFGGEPSIEGIGGSFHAIDDAGNRAENQRGLDGAVACKDMLDPVVRREIAGGKHLKRQERDEGKKESAEVHEGSAE